LSPRRARYLRQAASLSCAAAVGALLFSVHIATTVFREMPDDRMLAGRIAGRAFVGAYSITATAAVLALLIATTLRGGRGMKDLWTAGALLIAALLELFWIAPAIVQHGVGWPGSFASLHATGGALHLLLAVLALTLAWRLLNEGDEGLVVDR
jgi:hypothetical protein